MNLLVITDKSDRYEKLDKALSSKGYVLFFVTKGENFYSIIRKKNIRILILEMPENDPKNFSLLEEVKYFDPLLEIILIGSEVPPQIILDSIKFGATDYLPQPPEAKILLPILEKIKAKMTLRKETHRLEKELTEKFIFEGMVGKSLHMLEVFSLIEKVAKYPSSVLIVGETGTGKEMVAKAIHSMSPRKNQKFIACNCTAIPETLFESELFGYVRGAFTGADKSKNGLLKEANNGIVFLDEISEIPYATQAKLLRVLEERQFRPLGSTESVKIDVQIISATGKNLRERIELGAFREDLFHRINVIEIKLPPLRERREDIPLLFRNFLLKYNQKFSKRVAGISQRAQKVLLNYRWPGNVRELENLIERAVMLCQENFIDIKDLPEPFLKSMYKEAEAVSIPYPYAHLSLDEIEKKHIIEALKQKSNNKLEAARSLGLTRQALYRRLKKFHIPF
jgi:DNA-binding NtrC family response regulator